MIGPSRYGLLVLSIHDAMVGASIPLLLTHADGLLDQRSGSIESLGCCGIVHWLLVHALLLGLYVDVVVRQ